MVTKAVLPNRISSRSGNSLLKYWGGNGGGMSFELVKAEFGKLIGITDGFIEEIGIHSILFVSTEML